MKPIMMVLSILGRKIKVLKRVKEHYISKMVLSVIKEIGSMISMKVKVDYIINLLAIIVNLMTSKI